MPKKDKTENLLNGLAQAYSEACDAKDYKLCDLLRVQINAVLTGKQSLIKIESGLNLSADKLFS